jgi:hypothetical protein
VIGLCAVDGLIPSGSGNMHEAAREVDDGGDAHYCRDQGAGYAERWATIAGAHRARLDCVVDTLASLVPEKRNVHHDHERTQDVHDVLIRGPSLQHGRIREL